MIAYLEFADYLLIAESVLGVPAEAIANFDRIGLAQSALAAPQAGFGGVEAYALYMSRRRLRRRSEKAQRHAPPLRRASAPPRAIVRETTRVERLAYTRTQAAEALGISRSTFNRRVLPLVETVEMPWGALLIPVDELQRLISERRRPARAVKHPRASPGRPGHGCGQHRRAHPGRARRRQESGSDRTSAQR